MNKNLLVESTGNGEWYEPDYTESNMLIEKEINEEKINVEKINEENLNVKVVDNISSHNKSLVIPEQNKTSINKTHNKDNNNGRAIGSKR